MEQLKKPFSSFTFRGILGISLIFMLFAFILFAERSGISAQYTKPAFSELPETQILTNQDSFQEAPVTALILWDSAHAVSAQMYQEYCFVLQDMKLGYQAVDLSKESSPDFSSYELVLVLLSDLTPMQEQLFSLCDWVENGGSALFAAIEKNPLSNSIMGKLGILDLSYDSRIVDQIYVDETFMIGGGRSFSIDDAFESSIALQLIPEQTQVLVRADDNSRLPLIWKSSYGKGTFVINNWNVYAKSIRGFIAASISLLTDVCIYPVINGSAFYLDDFPSQIPSGTNPYIQRDYQTSIRDFYLNIWWPDMMNFAEEYQLRYTGLVIECYDDQTDGSVQPNQDTGSFLTLGNMLLRMGGELGYHGYNHQPLCLDGFNYRNLYDYKTWTDYTAMQLAFDELVAFCDKLFPDVTFSVYIPPSNILSDEGEQFLLRNYEQIRTISGMYFEDSGLEADCVQDFEVLEDGTVFQPRIVSGCKLSPFMELGVISELNMHYVNTHFTHPDDALDPERGAELGWENLKYYFREYLDWLYSSAPNLRNFTSSELSAAIQRYAALSLSREISENDMTIQLNHFYDNAQLLARFNKHKPQDISGGTLTHMTGDLYLISADSTTIHITFQQE